MGAGSKHCTVPKDRFPFLLNDLSKAIEPNAGKNIQSGFRKCGIFPLNRDQVLGRLPQQNLDETNDENQNIEEGLNNSLVNLLRTMRYGDGQNVKSRRRKIQVPAGKSVTSADFESTLDKDDQEDTDLERSMETLDEDSDPEMNLPLINFMPIMAKAQDHSSSEDSDMEKDQDHSSDADSEMDASLPSFTR
ncbi:unnamed protein product [Acanthoscelides obtectus]|uniref:Uncharacterized protein n=1 Tax=Acanthoscelides obtectus TaxID=200917 RepID=A0A9P0PW75_ACAOB|nr:unnamed protein product [Acanthoscelides obtectus]CAK1686973.1 hypothetical protein AOBTE_LOCUS36169 [Acanthoscelides obtectus]